MSTHTHQLKKRMKRPKQIFIVRWRRYVLQFPITTWKQYQGTSELKYQEASVYIQHVERTAFRTELMLMETDGKYCTGKIFNCDRNMIST
jgi:hypothetical protein